MEGEGEPPLDKSFGYAKNFVARFELGKEVGRGHFGHTCWAKGRKGELKGQNVAVKIISKAKVCGMCYCYEQFTAQRHFSAVVVVVVV